MDTPTVATQMTELLAGFTEFAAKIFSVITTNVLPTVTGNAYLLVGFYIIILSLGIGVFLRIVRAVGHHKG